MKLAVFTSEDVGRMEGGQIDGLVDSMDEDILIVISADGTGYTVDASAAKFLNAAGRKGKRDDVEIGDRVVVDGYFARNSTAMSARRVIDARTTNQP